MYIQKKTGTDSSQVSRAQRYGFLIEILAHLDFPLDYEFTDLLWGPRS